MEKETCKEIDKSIELYASRAADIPDGLKQIIKDAYPGENVANFAVFRDGTRIIVNMDFPDAANTIAFCRAYLTAREKGEKEAISEGRKEQIDLLEAAMRERQKRQLRRLLAIQPCITAAEKAYEVLEAFHNEPLMYSHALLMGSIYSYGYIEGKRAERARKKSVNG